MSRMNVSYRTLAQESLQYNHSAGQLNCVKHLAEQKNKDCDGEFHMGKLMHDRRVTILFEAVLSSYALVILQYEMICIGRQTGKLYFFTCLPSRVLFVSGWKDGVPESWGLYSRSMIFQRVTVLEGIHPIWLSDIWRAALNLALFMLKKRKFQRNE